MLKRTREIFKAAGEAAGIIEPSTTDAQAAAEQHRQSLIVAQTARENATQALQAAHDRGADDGEITRLEAALAAAKVDESRAEGRYRGAETRLQRASDADAEKVKAAARANLNDALAKRAAAAERIDASAREIAEAVAVFAQTDGAIAEARRAGVATQGPTITAHKLVEHALERAGALPSHWIGDKAMQPSAVDLATRDEGSIMAAA